MPVVAAKIRHELEHARQWDLAGGQALYELLDLVYEIGSARFGGLPQSGRFCNLLPPEQDANAAARRFARAQFDENVIAAQLAGDSAVLFRQSAEPRPDTLASRLISFAAIWSKTFEERVAHAGRQLHATLALIGPGGSALWNALQADNQFQHFIVEVVASEPTASTLAGLAESDITDRWQQLAATVESAMIHAHGVAGTIPNSS
jgi:hypothetical protein